MSENEIFEKEEKGLIHFDPIDTVKINQTII